ncbi:ankyrin repeat domain-containing protein [Mycobacterium asiaticum]|nr:ankyrin repeat domain-containing protein [Mycobacterium asiaticum]
MTIYMDIIEGARAWQGVLDTSVMTDELVRAGHRLADAAKVGNWPEVMKVLDSEWSWLTINQWRPGGFAWFTVLHQAAWHGAPTAVVEELLERGALRSLQDAKGRTAFDIAITRNRTSALRELLEPPRPTLTDQQIRALDAQLAELIDGRLRGRVYDGDLRKVLRYPPVGILHELPGQRVWCPMPAKYAFHIELQRGGLEVKSWCGFVEGSGQTHLVTPEGSVLVDQGFV